MLPFVARLERRRCSTANLHRLMIISNLLGTYRIALSPKVKRELKA